MDKPKQLNWDWYRRCPRCNYVYETEFFNSNSKCSNCGKNYSLNKWENYPSDAACGFSYQFEVGVHSYDEDGLSDYYEFHEIQPACLFLCALYDECLKLLIKDKLEILKTPNIVTELVLNSYQGQEKLCNAFKSLAGISIKDAIKEFDPCFYDSLYVIIKARNKYIHGRYGALDHVTKNDLLYLDRVFLDIFVNLNNKYVCKQN